MNKPSTLLPALEFLTDLSRHNDREWFNAHRPVYDPVQ
jgi:uncharacterized protein (DUF2461 family)